MATRDTLNTIPVRFAKANLLQMLEAMQRMKKGDSKGIPLLNSGMGVLSSYRRLFAPAN